MDKYNFNNLFPVYEHGAGEGNKGNASKGKDEVVLCLIKNYVMKMYGEVIAACILITLALHEDQ